MAERRRKLVTKADCTLSKEDKELEKIPKNCAVCNVKSCNYHNVTAHKRHKSCPLVADKI